MHEHNDIENSIDKTVFDLPNEQQQLLFIRWVQPLLEVMLGTFSRDIELWTPLYKSLGMSFHDILTHSRKDLLIKYGIDLYLSLDKYITDQWSGSVYRFGDIPPDDQIIVISNPNVFGGELTCGVLISNIKIFLIAKNHVTYKFGLFDDGSINFDVMESINSEDIITSFFAITYENN